MISGFYENMALVRCCSATPPWGMNEVPEEVYVIMNEVAIVPSQFDQEDLAELGATLADAGWTSLEARALIAQVRQVAGQTALGMAPQILEQVRIINAARLAAIYNRVRALHTYAGMVSRDRVLEIIQGAYSTPPRTQERSS